MKLTGAEIVIQTLIEQGVTDVFGYPGGQVLNIYDALYKESDKINHILTAHEQGASHAADGYSRVTGKVGVCIATSGPGATNLVTGIATAMLDSIPMVAITGNVPSSLIGKDSFQEIDITGITLPITKHNYFVHRVEDLADSIREAFRIAKSGRPGPVLIDIPKDVQVAGCEFEPKPIAEKFPLPVASQNKIDEAIELINASERP
ncbi:MAG: acetolactate synthase large subunit, partial [Clostridia bacterium]|nr:acetolactate synthase large subunit [Clostridia bacterium]